MHAYGTLMLNKKSRQVHYPAWRAHDISFVVTLTCVQKRNYTSKGDHAWGRATTDQ